MRCFRIREILIGSSASESAGTALCVAQVCDFLDGRIEDALADQLSNAIALGNGKVYVRVVEQDDADISTIVLVNDSSADVNEVLDCQTRARGDAAVTAFRKLDLDVSLDDSLATSRNHDIVSAESRFK